jgi:hypothetical protein
MAETLGSLGFSIVGNSNSLDFTSRLEEFSNSPFFGTETHVSAEDGVRFSSSAGGGTTGSGSVTRELDIEVRSIEFSTVGGSEGSSGFLMSVVLHEADSLLVKMLALNELIEFTEQGLEGFLIGVHGDASHEKLNLAFLHKLGLAVDDGNDRELRLL